MSKKLFSIAICSFFFISCTKEINIDLNSSNSQLVIEGSITDESGPYFVKLSKTINFSESNNFPSVTGAMVIVSDNTGVVDTLTETASGTYQTSSIVGQHGSTYTLKVLVEGKEYNAITTMPYKVNLDSIQFESDNAFNENTFEFVPVYLDPATERNNYRFKLTVNGETDNSFLVNNDNNSNGLINQQSFSSDDVKIFEGDTVIISMFCIDSDTYTYYKTLEELLGSNPIFSATPANPPNNITGNKALGHFSAYTTQSIIQVAK